MALFCWPRRPLKHCSDLSACTARESARKPAMRECHQLRARAPTRRQHLVAPNRAPTGRYGSGPPLHLVAEESCASLLGISTEACRIKDPFSKMHHARHTGLSGIAWRGQLQRAATMISGKKSRRIQVRSTRRASRLRVHTYSSIHTPSAAMFRYIYYITASGLYSLQPDRTSIFLPDGEHAWARSLRQMPGLVLVRQLDSACALDDYRHVVDRGVVHSG